jgi:hypothetical protein
MISVTESMDPTQTARNFPESSIFGGGSIKAV